ncbi:MAG TPA: alpha/beta hydrolase-fold protein [Pseudoxanthomonas sp.]|nr:alpha/beta hydrolase-fold protein [Pseudoxanthomonas sp.]
MVRALRIGMAAVLCLLGAATAQAATPASATVGSSGEWRTVELPGTSQFDLHSRQTDRRYRIFVSTPQGEAPAEGFPVIYVLDGNAAFPVAHTLARSAERVGQRRQPGFVAPVIVAIGYPQDGQFDDQARGEDYTPPAPNLSNTGDRVSLRQGGADRFLAFITDELKPTIEARIRINRSRQTLVGHSYGGLFALHVLFTQGDAFQRYVAGSPSIWWNERYILQERPRLSAEVAKSTRLLITVGSLEQTAPAGPAGDSRAAMLTERRMVDSARDLAADVNGDPRHPLATQFQLLEGENHHSAAFPMLRRAIDFALAP